MTDGFNEYVVSYTFDGAQYGLTIPARSEREASQRLRAIGTTGQIDGILVETIRADIPGAGLYVRAKTALMNLLSPFLTRKDER